MPFEQARELLQEMLGMQVSKATAPLHSDGDVVAENDRKSDQRQKGTVERARLI